MTTLIVLLVVEILCAVLTAWVFRSNGRPGWVGAILGLLFGIPALVISLIIFTVGSRRRGGAATA
jgi:hypothetical protein